jgi:PIN domain nuclease of toxin-antitoxin system
MKLLLDTPLLLWAAGNPDLLPAAARSLLDDPENEPIFSSASLWEVAAKRGLGRGDFRFDARLLRRGLLDNGYGELPITSEHAVAVSRADPNGVTRETAGQEIPKLLSFRSAGAARESGTHEHRTTSPLELQVFVGSGSAPAGRPGMTDFGSRRILAQPRSKGCCRIAPEGRLPS